MWRIEKMVEMAKDGDGTSFAPLGYHTTLCMGYGYHKGVLKLPKQLFHCSQVILNCTGLSSYDP